MRRRDQFDTVTLGIVKSVVFGIAVTLTVGCGATKPLDSPATVPVPVTIRATSRPALGANALLTLDEIAPRPTLPLTTSAPTSTQPAPSLEALELYARARDALATNQRFTGINLLERVTRLDPGSAEPFRLLSRAYTASGHNAKAIDALATAADLEPDDLRTQTSLGRLYLSRNDVRAGLDHLRLALQTREYASDESGAIVADFFLARALQQQGYDMAALRQYVKVLERLNTPSLAIRGDPEVNDWSSRPHAIYAEVARLHEKLGEDEQALARWKQVAQRDPDDYDTRARIVNLLLALDRREDALRESAEYVRRTGASARSLELLRDVCRRTGNEQAAFDELRRLHGEMPSDRAITFALVDLLGAAGRNNEAEAMLVSSARSKWDAETVRRLFDYYSTRHRAPEAARLLIEASAADPEETSEHVRLFADLLRPQRRDALRASDIEAFTFNLDHELPESASERDAGSMPRPSKNVVEYYFTALAARGQQRNALARKGLEFATAHYGTPFAPAFRDSMASVWIRTDLNAEAKRAAADEMISQVRRRGAPDLADELGAISLSAQGRSDEAAAALDRVMRERKGRAGQVELAYADLQRQAGNHARFEQVVWRVVSDHPTWETPYMRLIQHHLAGDRVPAAITVVQRWVAADPSSAAARLSEAELLTRTGQLNEAVREAGELLRQRPGDPDVVGRATRIFLAAGRQAPLVEILEQLQRADPVNLAIVEALLDAYIAQSRGPDATKLIDAARAGAAREPRLLYYISHLYSQVDRKDLAQETLLAALDAAPNDPGANNDLGYTWADEGTNLDRAETMIRKAVEAEPDNASFLDSLGWVLYKRGQFDEARNALERSIEALRAGAVAVDPVVQDHLGDTLHRLGEPKLAAEQWKAAFERLGTLDLSRPDWSSLRAKLEQKLAQVNQGVPVSVAPTGAADVARPARAEK